MLKATLRISPGIPSTKGHQTTKQPTQEGKKNSIKQELKIITFNGSAWGTSKEFLEHLREWPQ